MLQEIVHGPDCPKTGHDRSVELLLRAARLKVKFGRQVIFIMGNHDLAQMTGNEIAKEGRGACKAFVAGVEYCFGDDAAEVLEAVGAFQASMPLAVRCPNRVLISHSLPSPYRMELAGTEILTRGYKQDDMSRGGPAYEWTWGRDQTDEQTDMLAEMLDVDFFLLGHRKVENWELVTSRAVAIAADTLRGCVVEFGTADTVNAETIQQHVRLLAEIRRG